MCGVIAPIGDVRDNQVRQACEYYAAMHPLQVGEDSH